LQRELSDKDATLKEEKSVKEKLLQQKSTVENSAAVASSTQNGVRGAKRRISSQQNMHDVQGI
jgi:hypothetical protein